MTAEPATTVIPTQGSVPAPPRWAEIPTCATVDPELFFPLDETGGQEAAAAKALCAGCPLRARCLDYALSSGMAAGIWGGLSTPEREALLRAEARRRRAGRVR